MDTFPSKNFSVQRMPPGCEELTYSECKNLHMLEEDFEDSKITYANTKQSQRSIVTKVNEPVKMTSRQNSRMMDPLLAVLPGGDYYGVNELLEASISRDNIVIFYSELLQKNIYGVLFSTDEEAKRFAAEYMFGIIQNEYPRYAHYLQLFTQITSRMKKYWDEENIVIKYDNPLKGKINYWMAEREGRYLVFVVYSE